MTAADQIRARNRVAAQRRARKLEQAGLRPQSCFLEDDLLAFLDKLKEQEGFNRRDQAVAFLIRQAMTTGLDYTRKDYPTVTT